MISSLAIFLLHILYQGNYPARAAWVLLMFTMGSVAVARIAIEQDRQYSIGYAIALGCAAFVVLAQYLNNPIFCLIILVVIGYLADRIVHDCTLIDDSQDASGQGLIDAGGDLWNELTEQAGDRGVEGSPTSDNTDKPSSMKVRKGHQPGRTVMYLALAALPMFGIGQFLSNSDGSTWGSGQRLLMLYLFAALSLLVTTSFLGLRRYLRQRRTDMPKDVSVAWIASGLGLIALVLVVAYLAPIPGQLLGSLKLPEFMTLTSKKQSASRYGWGDEAAEKTTDGASTTRNDQNPDGKDIESQYTRNNAKPGNSGDGQGKKGPAGKQSGGKKPQNGNEGSSGQDPGKGKSQNSESQSSSSKQQQSKQSQQSKSGGNHPATRSLKNKAMGKTPSSRKTKANRNLPTRALNPSRPSRIRAIRLRLIPNLRMDLSRIAPEILVIPKHPKTRAVKIRVIKKTKMILNNAAIQNKTLRRVSRIANVNQTRTAAETRNKTAPRQSVRMENQRITKTAETTRNAKVTRVRKRHKTISPRTPIKATAPNPPAHSSQLANCFRWLATCSVI